MPTQVIVVKRSQRRIFSGPRALPDWLRSLWLARSRQPESESGRGLSPAGPADRGTQSSSSAPTLRFDPNGAHRCNGCGLCASVCPGRCLRLTSEGQGASQMVTAFEIARGRCIGCGVCCEVCPEDAIEMSLGLEVERSSYDGRLPVADLLTVSG